MNDIFNIKRFGHYARYSLAEQKKNIFYLLVTYILILLLVIGKYLVYPQLFYYAPIMERFPLSKLITSSILVTLFLYFSDTSVIIKPFFYKQRINTSLTLPVSSLERYLWTFIYSFLHIICVLAINIGTWIYLLKYRIGYIDAPNIVESFNSKRFSFKSFSEVYSQYEINHFTISELVSGYLRDLANYSLSNNILFFPFLFFFLHSLYFCSMFAIRYYSGAIVTIMLFGIIQFSIYLYPLCINWIHLHPNIIFVIPLLTIVLWIIGYYCLKYRTAKK